MDVLREKLAARLGATPSPNGHYGMQVSNRGESGENIITSVRPSAASVSAARRKHAAASAAPSDANMDIAANSGQSLLPTHWDYAGAEGPDAWGGLRPEYGKCATGQRQSPIDIRGGIAAFGHVTGEPATAAQVFGRIEIDREIEEPAHLGSTQQP